jgi:lysozyme
VCLDILKKDTAIAASCIASNVKVPLTCNQYGATLSFIFNLGCGSYKSSGFFRNTNNKNYKAAGENMKLWNKAGQPPRVVQGLVNRRADEVALWSAADSTRCFS